MADERLEKQDIAAAVGARQHLGAEYDDVIAASLADRIEKEIDARVSAQLMRNGVGPGYQVPPQQDARRQHSRDGGTTGLGIVSVIMGIPITAIVAGDMHSITGIAVAWAGIALVNIAHAWGRQHRNG